MNHDGLWGCGQHCSIGSVEDKYAALQDMMGEYLRMSVEETNETYYLMIDVMDAEESSLELSIQELEGE